MEPHAISRVLTHQHEFLFTTRMSLRSDFRHRELFTSAAFGYEGRVERFAGRLVPSFYAFSSRGGFRLGQITRRGK